MLLFKTVLKVMYNESQHWTSLAFIVWTNIPQKKVKQVIIAMRMSKLRKMFHFW